MYTYKIYQNGELRATLADQSDDWPVFRYLIDTQPHSVSRALSSGGWRVEELDQETNEIVHWNPYNKPIDPAEWTAPDEGRKPGKEEEE